MRNDPIAWLGVLLLLAIGLAGCLADQASVQGTDAPGIQPTGETKEFDLYIHAMSKRPYPGVEIPQWGFSFSEDPSTAQVPGPEIRVTAGDKVKIRFHNMMSNFAHTVHWHGIHLPWQEDGVPYVTQDPVGPGETFTYEFIAKPSGTFWYHCHVNTEHDTDMGMYGPLIVEPQDGQDPAYDAEETLMFSAFDKNHVNRFTPGDMNEPKNGDPLSYESWARAQAESVNRNQQYRQAVETTGVKEQRDWWPVTHPPYDPHYNTFMVNGYSFPWTEPLFIAEGETLRLRLISVNTVVAWHLHGHHFKVTHKDGFLLENPYRADTLMIGPGERYDVYVEGNNPGIWAMHSHMPGQVQNEHINPGGMFTTLVYDQYKDQARSVERPAGQAYVSSQFLGLYN